MKRLAGLCALFLAGSAAASERMLLGVEVGVAGATFRTGNPYHPRATGAGLALGLRAGTALTQRLAIFYSNRIPLYLFASKMPGLGIALDCFDFNSVVLRVMVRDDLSFSLGPSFDFMIPFFGNRAFGAGVEARVEYSRRRSDDDRAPRLTIGLNLHPAALSYEQKLGYFSYLKTLFVADLSVGLQWR